jgi:hypothetical protein
VLALLALIAPTAALRAQSSSVFPKAALGTWTGPVRQIAPLSTNAYHTTMSITRTPAGRVRGKIAYPDLECGGTVAFQKQQGNRIFLLERITYGSCIDHGTIVVRLIDAKTLDWKWYLQSGELAVYGKLHRTR